MKTILVDAVNSFIIEKNDQWVIFQEMYNLLKKYSNRKIILTGATDDKFELYGLNKMPYEVFTLRHDPEKTDPTYFQKMLEYFNLKAENVIYFEHNPDAVKSAQSVDIKTFYYDKESKDLDGLKKFIDENIK